MARFVAFLRGVNVGGARVVKMADLKAIFEKAGATDVATFIQSGNVLFIGPNGQGSPATILSWTNSSILMTVPSGSVAGEYQVAVTTTSGSTTLNYHVGAC